MVAIDRSGHPEFNKVITQEAMMDGEEGTTKYAKGAKRQAKLQSSTFAHFVVKSDFR
jgi:hypothetical protein